jgi:hypothetical protein
MPRKSDEQQFTTYLIERVGRERLKVTVPSSWKVTYGPVVLTKGGYGQEYAIRFYESANQQRAIFTGVLSFRDLSIPVQRSVQKVEAKGGRKQDDKDVSTWSSERVEEEWRDDNVF